MGRRYYPAQTAEGWLYLAVVIDIFSRKVVGWSMGSRLYAELVVNALDMALHNRRPAKGLIHHSDSKNIGAGCSWVS